MPHKEGKKNRKYGRAGRSPAHNRYNIERRWEKNKERKRRKHEKALAKKAARKNAEAKNQSVR